MKTRYLFLLLSMFTVFMSSAQGALCEHCDKLIKLSMKNDNPRLIPNKSDVLKNIPVQEGTQNSFAFGFKIEGMTLCEGETYSLNNRNLNGDIAKIRDF